MATRSRLFCLLLLILAQAACGQKGPLYMEGHEPRGMKVVKPKNDAETAPQVEPSAPN
jgi:predicted small lipoprotein YifL